MQVIAPARAYTIDALLAEGFTARQIRDYIWRGLLPHACGTGAAAYYTDIHLECLRKIKRARDEYRSLDDIREMIEYGVQP